MSSPERLCAKQNQLIVDHMHLVPPIVDRFLRVDSRRPRTDVESDGNFGLVRAARLYNPTHESNIPFENYAPQIITFSMFSGARHYFGRDSMKPSVFSLKHRALDAPAGEQYANQEVNERSPEILINQRDVTRWILSGLREREILFLFRYFVEGMHMDEVAEEAGVHKSTVSRGIKAATHAARFAYWALEDDI